jgi:hypothetical protein
VYYVCAPVIPLTRLNGVSWSLRGDLNKHLNTVGVSKFINSIMFS